LIVYYQSYFMHIYAQISQNLIQISQNLINTFCVFLHMQPLNSAFSLMQIRVQLLPPHKGFPQHSP
jgi:hypothetical protein